MVFPGVLGKTSIFEVVKMSFRVARKKICRNINYTLVYGVFYRSNNPEARRDWPLLIHDGCND